MSQGHLTNKLSSLDARDLNLTKSKSLQLQYFPLCSFIDSCILLMSYPTNTECDQCDDEKTNLTAQDSSSYDANITEFSKTHCHHNHKSKEIYYKCQSI
jgi:hypothetical protein